VLAPVLAPLRAHQSEQVQVLVSAPAKVRVQDPGQVQEPA